MRIVYCTSNFSGYTTACWRALHAHPDAQLRVIAFHPDNPNAPFQEEMLEGLDYHLIERHGDNTQLVKDLFTEHRAEAACIAGYSFPYYRALVHTRHLGARYYTCFDTQLKGTLKQRLLRFRFPKFFANVSGALVASERSYQLVRSIGIPEDTIRRGLYAFDEPTFAKAAQARANGPWPRSFITISRAIDIKGIDILLDAYTRYRAAVSDPWSLIFCGTGPLGERLAATEGVDYRGFVQPNDLPEALAEAGAFFLCSRYEPWGVVVAEAGGAGLPLAVSEASGASVDLVQDYYNGLKLQTGSSASIEEAMHFFHENEDRLPEMGARSRSLASAYSAEVWAERILGLCRVGA